MLLIHTSTELTSQKREKEKSNFDIKKKISLLHMPLKPLLFEFSSTEGIL